MTKIMATKAPFFNRVESQWVLWARFWNESFKKTKMYLMFELDWRIRCKFNCWSIQL